MTSPGSHLRASAFVDWALRWGAPLWIAAVLLAIPAAWRTASLYLHLHSELEQLLPSTAPSVVALDELRVRMPGLRHLGVTVDSGNAAELPAAEQFLDALATRIRAYPPALVASVRTGVTEERRFVEDHAALYVDLEDLETLRDHIEARRDWEAAKSSGALLDLDKPPPALDFDDVEQKYDRLARGPGRFDGDRFSSRELHLSTLLVQFAATDAGPRQGEALLARVKADVASIDPARYSAALRVGYTGDVAIDVEETEALKADLSSSSVAVVVLELAVLLAYYRWWRSLVLLLPPLVLAAVYSFALASSLPFGIRALNSNTAFLGSIILGNGINFGIVLLGRYVEERRAAVPVRTALAVAVAGTWKGTAAAALAAGIAYASLGATDFRGFRQFGVVGGIGMALSWLLAFVLMPPLALWIDREPRIVATRWAPMRRVGVWVARYRLAIVGAAAALAVASAFEMRTFGVNRFETDFAKLRRADTWTRGEGYWGRKMDALLGSYLTPTVILTDDVAQARAIGRVLSSESKRPPLEALVARVRTLDDVVPARQAEKIAIANQIREDLTPAMVATMSQATRDEVDRFLGAGSLEPLSPADVPEVFTMGLRERDGTVGREVLVYPRPTHALWEGPPLAYLISRLRTSAAAALPPGARPGRVAGSLALSNDILGAVRRDGVRSTLSAFLGVVGAVVILLRRGRATVLVIASLLLAVLWLAAATTALGIKINFANFIAYPITFGIGVDYAVNVASRWEAGGRGSMSESVGTTGGAVVLCSATTVIGYSSLLFAENRALFLFGLMAVVGEVACVTTAVLVLPAAVACLATRTASAVAARRTHRHTEPLPP